MQMPLNLMTIITRDANAADLSLAPAHVLRSPLPSPQGHFRVQTLVKAVTLDGPLHLPPPLVAMATGETALGGTV